jgi:hypothetical protein
VIISVHAIVLTRIYNSGVVALRSTILAAVHLQLLFVGYKVKEINVKAFFSEAYLNHGICVLISYLKQL